MFYRVKTIHSILLLNITVFNHDFLRYIVIRVVTNITKGKLKMHQRNERDTQQFIKFFTRKRKTYQYRVSLFSIIDENVYFEIICFEV